MAIFEEFVGDTLRFGENLRTNQHVVSIYDTLILRDTDQSQRLRESLVQTLVFTQVGSYTLSGTRSITQTLTFRQSATRDKIEQLYQNLNFTQTVDPGNKWPSVTQTLVFHDSVTVNNTTGIVQTLAFTQSATASFIRSQHITDTLSFQSYAVGYKDSYLFISGPVYNIVPQSFVTFAVGTNILTLRVPEFGNKDEMLLRRIQRESLGGDLIIYRDPAWSTAEGFDLEFTYIDDISAQATQDFVRGTLGQLIIFTDHEGHQWTGMFNSPDFEITTPGRYNNSFKLRFEVIFA